MGPHSLFMTLTSPDHNSLCIDNAEFLAYFIGGKFSNRETRQIIISSNS